MGGAARATTASAEAEQLLPAAEGSPLPAVAEPRVAEKPPRLGGAAAEDAGAALHGQYNRLIN